MNHELSNLLQFEKETKRLLFEKSQDALQSKSKIQPLRNKVIDLEEKVEEAQAKMAKLEERATQREVQLGQVEGELAQKIEFFKQTEEELTNDVTDGYGAGFQDAMAQVACVHPEIRRSGSLIGSLCPGSSFFCIVTNFLMNNLYLVHIYL